MYSTFLPAARQASSAQLRVSAEIAGALGDLGEIGLPVVFILDGDISGEAVLAPEWRLIGPATAMNGIMLLGWSTAVIFSVLTRFDTDLVGDRDKPAN